MEFIRREHEITLESPEGQTLARVTFPAVDAGTVDINHTFVDDSLRGQGIASALVQAAVAQIHEMGGQVTATCSYARDWLQRHPEA